jgi:hypothetical protein
MMEEVVNLTPEQREYRDKLFEEIWNTFSSIDVSKYVKQIKPKNSNMPPLSYLSWAYVWDIAMQKYPQTQYHVDREVTSFKNGTCEVHTTVWIGPCMREMWLPVMDNRYNSFKEPSSRDISDAKMRCFVKNFAMFGLGFKLYAGEDLPDKEPDVPVASRDAEVVGKSNPATAIAKSEPEKNEDGKTKGEVALVTFGALLDGCNDPEEVSKIYKDNAKVILEVKNSEPDNYKKLYELFTTAKAHAKGEK